ncbi:MMPL family transporter [Streptomyces alkaliterrae]|uniref:MMPL family transporter n=2 Tax=Streptomyces alkaliterrae TaxID=2213162 RepID=A0A7W3ZUI7_9ACTN|nr:MMPL family transporter [Streptomyces alkaliterrae]MBB1260966.1 MMPL family transporter [Streptomyces alkaliterrae]
MATFLASLGRFSYRRRRLVALIWVALLLAVGGAAATASSTPGMNVSMPGTEAQRAFDLIDERFPQSHADGATAQMVFQAPKGETITEGPHKATIDRTVARLAKDPEVASVADPYTVRALSEDGRTAYARVTFERGMGDVPEESQDQLLAIADAARADGLTVETGGTALETPPATGAGEIVGVLVAAVVLVITFGSLVAAGMPLITALVGVGIGVGGVIALGGLLDLDGTTSILAAMIGLAVGIDYALFIVSRHRAERAAGHDGETAAGRAVGTAGSAVVFAGLTVLIALAGLAVVGVPMLTKMGLAAAATVAIAVLVAVSLVPAVLGFAGDRVLGRRARRAATADTTPSEDARPALGTRWARFVLRRPVAVLLTAVIGLGAIAVPASQLELGMPDDGSRAEETTQRRAYDLLSENFGPGANGPLMLVVDASSVDTDQERAVDRVAERVRALDGVLMVTEPEFSDAGGTALLTVVPATGPTDKKTEDLVHAIRDTAAAGRADTGAEALVTGATAMNIDFSEKLNDALVPYLALVVGLAFLLLMVVFRSVLVPLKAALGFLLSVLAALGAVVAVFQWGWLADLLGVAQTGPIVSMAPIFLVGVVFGLAMDYEVFLVTRMREAYVHGEEPREAIVTGFTHGARVVAAAAVIMISVFAGFIASDEPMIKMMGFGLAIAVFFDAFVVRMAIVPAVLALLGRSAWWLPKWLDRVLPSVDVEGEALTKQAPAPEPTKHPVNA